MNEKYSKLGGLADSDIYRELKSIKQQIIRGVDTGGSGVITPGGPITPPSQAANQIRNGSFAHSVGSWDNVATADNRRYECAHWYSHPDTVNAAMHTWTTAVTGAVSFVDANVTVATDNIAITPHGFDTGDAVRLTTTGVLPAGLALATTYYVIRTDDNNLELAATLANAVAGTPSVDITAAAGGGTHTITPINYALKSDDHTSYSSSQSNWTLSDAPAGCARINEDYTLDAPLAQPTGEPGYTMYAVFNCALANRSIYAPPTARITCGLYALQAGIWGYLKGLFEVSATVSGTVGTPTSRDYVVHVRTARGFTLQTPVETVAAAPSDADFTAGAVVVLSWLKPLQFGVIGYDIYRNTGGTYRLLERIETGLTSYIDNNSFLDVAVAAYPAADFTSLAPFTATSDNVLSNLAIDGVDANWDTLPFALRIPSNYNHSLTDFDRKQWVRWALQGLNSQRFDIRFLEVVFAGLGSTSLFTTRAGDAFNAGMVGKTVVLSATGQADFTTTIATYVAVDQVTLAVSPPYGSSQGIAVIQGAADPNVLYIDLAHISFGDNAIFGFHPDDLSPDRGIPPVAANGSNQGGIVIVPPVGGGDGGVRCPWVEEMVTVTDGAGSVFKKRAGDLLPGDYTIIGNRMATVSSVAYAVEDIWETETENGYTARTSHSHKYFTNSRDQAGQKLDRFKVGDSILTNIEGRNVETTVTKIELIQRDGVVVEIGLRHFHHYLIGSGPGKWGGIASHNRKADDDILDVPV